MINITKIQTALSGLVGFKQPYNPDYAIVDSTNQASSSGYYVTDNPYAKIEYIKDNQDYVDISTTGFNLLLSDIKNSSISNVCNQVFSDYDFIDRTLLFKNASNKIEVETLPTGFVGYHIRVTGLKNVAFKISRVLLDFQGTGSFTLLLWNTAKKTAIQSKVITITTDHQEVSLDWVIDNTDTTYKGEYYIGYINNSLTVTPYKREWNSGNVLSNPTYLQVERVKVPNHLTNTLFDLDDVDGLSEDSGLNLDITVYEDYTDFIINNKMLFARAIQINSIIGCIQLYLSSLRSNSNQAQSTQLYEKLMIELKGTANESTVKVIGLENQLLGEVASIRTEVSKLKKGLIKANQIFAYTLR
jgi:hypothetical protein